MKLVISDAYKGLRAAAAKVLKATRQRCKVHFLRNALTHPGKGQRQMRAGLIHSTYEAVEGNETCRGKGWARRLPAQSAITPNGESDQARCRTDADRPQGETGVIWSDTPRGKDAVDRVWLLASHRRVRAGLPRPETFAFLRFTHYCGWTRDGRYIVKHKTQSRRVTRKLNEVREEAWRRMHEPLADQHRWLTSVSAAITPTTAYRTTSGHLPASDSKSGESDSCAFGGVVNAAVVQASTGSTR